MPHIVSAFDDDLIAIQAKISEMGSIAEEILKNALEAVRTRDDQLAEATIKRDKRLDALEMELEEMATTTIALRQPMAKDLRTVLSAIKISATLERIGDLSKNIAKRTLIVTQSKPVKLTSSIVHMGEQTQKQLTDVLDAYASRDTKLAVEIWNRDADLDETYNAIFREVVTYMMEDARTISVGSQLLFIAKNLERIGDHTTHISEKIHYIVEGTELGDDRPKGEPMGADLAG
jgi:phosphate transport system protein